MPDMQRSLGYTPKDLGGGLTTTADASGTRGFDLPGALIRSAATQGAGAVMPSFEPDSRYGSRSISGDLPEVAIQDVRFGLADPNAGAYPGNLLFGSAGAGLEGGAGVPWLQPFFGPEQTPGQSPWTSY